MGGQKVKKKKIVDMQLTFQHSWDYTDGTRLPIAEEDLPTLLMYTHIERQQLLDDNI